MGGGRREKGGVCGKASSVPILCVLFAATPSQNSRREGEEEKEKKEGKGRGQIRALLPPRRCHWRPPPAGEPPRLAMRKEVLKYIHPWKAVRAFWRRWMQASTNIHAPPPRAISLSHTDTHWHTHSLTHRRARWRRRRGGGSVCLLVSSCLRFPRPGAHKHAHARSAPLAEGEQPAKPRCSRPGRHLALGEL